MADICIRCGKAADGLLCPECSQPPVKKATPKASPPVEPVVEVAPPPVVLPPVAPAAEQSAPVLPPAPPAPAKVVKPAKPAKPPKPPKPPKVKKEISPERKKLYIRVLLVALLIGLIVNFLPQIKDAANSGKDFITSKFEKEAASPSASASPSTSAEASPTATPTPSATPSETPSPTAKATSTQSSQGVAAGARSAVISSLKRCAQSTSYSPPGCPFAEKVRINGSGISWEIVGTPKITLSSSNGGVQTLRVSSKVIAHLQYGKLMRDVDYSFTRTAIATPSGNSYTIKWK